MMAAVSIFNFWVSEAADGGRSTVDGGRSVPDGRGWLVIFEGGGVGVCANNWLVQSAIKSVNSPNFNC